MKRLFLRVAVGTALFVGGLATGAALQHASNGYRLEVHRSQDFDSPIGDVRLSYVTETVGIPFLDPESSIIEFEGRTIYKAQRTFQEDSPVARNVVTAGNSIDWEDGEFRYRLTINNIREDAITTNGSPGGSR